ncbi:phosphatidylserine/phosphatidylglycerophosphate/cardiolipin synthase [Desulfitobacterium dichloroeliminans LMG P-21439]|uniref:Cardiolipin synthase n=1 Tax=Desulfitobacterium dichloroeliminans (strain LMG P-21439 / DCA1) TaxID=871963 RepID=L0F6D5_DESDL|nr:cardiolipin synthase [Desulfitobacterium dichloroeliminans]AGA69404.1 phosphatidylserine/phosphatidylglycerophosphate/cardiolipin synthase [Desulfitobacterium dichloroeliminans LMG P-21439]
MIRFFIGLALITFFLALVIVYLEKENPENTTSWLSFLGVLNVFGFVLYLIFGCTPIKNRLFRRKHIPGDRLPRLTHHQVESMNQDHVFFQESLIGKHLSKIVLKSSYAPLSGNNSALLLHNGQGKFEALLQDLECAQDHIHMEYYIYHEDKIGETIQKILIRKARAGIKIRLILDGLGSKSLSKSFIQELKAAGIEYQWFFPLRFPQLLATLNYRNHRKLVVIDGKIGYLGGINIGDEYLSLSPKYGFWRDTHLRLEGESVQTIQETFLNDWYFTTNNIVRDKRYFPEYELFGDLLTQIIGGGPDSKHESVKALFYTIVSAAQSEIFITTPYFIPDESMVMALKSAALKGASVKILLQGKPDHKLPYLASSSYYCDLVKVGVEIYRYQKGILHSKVITIDQEISIIGSANFDIRSFQLDFELSAVIYNANFTKKIVCEQQADLMDSIKVTEEDIAQRTRQYSFQIALARLLSPFL